MINRRLFMASASAFACAPVASGLAQQVAKPSLLPVTMGLGHPWGMVFLPDGTLLVSERPGRLRHLSLRDAKLSAPVAGIPPVDADGQGGLLGLAVDPDFTSNRLVYMSFSEAREGGNATAVYRGRLKEDVSALKDGRVIFRQNMAKASSAHFVGLVRSGGPAGLQRRGERRNQRSASRIELDRGRIRSFRR